MQSHVIWQARPVFVTSTFLDMHAERDYLREHVFPALEERLRERYHHLEPIDLRLGVETGEMADPAARELLILKVCLGEIVRSRPFLIGLIGDRYGWAPPGDRMRAAAGEAGYEGDLTGRSVTALEIEFGVLGHASQRARSRFYLREPLPYDQMPPDKAAEFSEEHSSEPGAAERAARLQQLKDSLKSELPAERVQSYTARWDSTTQRVVGLEAWGLQVIEDLWTDLEAETRAFASAAATTWQEQEARLLDGFVATACREFVGRADLLDRLIDVALGSAPDEAVRGACIVGAPGSGKSGLFAELYRQLRSRDVILLAHAAGIGPRAGDVDAVLRRWCAELATVLGISDPSTDITARDELKQTFSTLVARAATCRRLVLLLDALNQFERTASGMHATWLPERWPDNARLIATAIAGTESEAIGRRPGVEIVSLPPLTGGEAERIARAVAGRRRADVRPELLAQLTAAHGADGHAAAGNPLWLELALEEIILLDADDFARAKREFTGSSDEQLHALRMAVAATLPADVEGLYGFLLRHAEQVHGERWAREFANLIAASRAGWRESDLRTLLPARTGEAWSDLRFAALRRGFRAHLVQRGADGQWDFAHAQMRQSIRIRNLSDEAVVHDLHATISEHIESLLAEDPIRQRELMHHLLGSGDLTRAGRHYASDLPPAALDGATRALAAALVEQPHQRAQLADALLAAPGLSDAIVGKLCNRYLFELNDALGSASLSQRLPVLRAPEESLVQLAATDPDNAGWQHDLAVSHNNIGDVLIAQGNLLGALAAFRAGQAIRERLAATDPGNARWQRELSVSRLLIGDVLVEQGNLPAALAAFRAGLAIAERLASADAGNTGRQRELSVSHEKMGDVLKAQGNLPRARAAFEHSLAIRERLAALDPGNERWQHDLSVSHQKIGDVLVAEGNLSGALKAFRASLAIGEPLAAADPGNASWQRSLSVSHNKVGDVLVAQGNLPAALAAFRADLAIAERLASADPGNAGWQRDLAVSHSRIGDILVTQEDLPGAMAALRQSLTIDERLAVADPGNAHWQRGLSVSHEKMGDVLKAQGNLPRARAAFEHSLAIRERLAALDPGNERWQRDLAVSRLKIGNVRVAQHQRDLQSWHMLPWWRRVRVKKPEPPTGI